MKLIIFDMDGTILRGRTILFLSKEFSFNREARIILESKFSSIKKSIELAHLLKDVPIEDFMGVIKKIPLNKGAAKTMASLKAMGHKTAIVTDSYDIVAEYYKELLGMDRAVGIKLKVLDGRITGEIEAPINCRTDAECGFPSICKKEVMMDLCREFDIPPSLTVAVGDNLVDVCMIQASGLGIAFDPKATEVDRAADVVIRSHDLRDVIKYL
jgi:phosphoserine phosphatase SerB